MCREQKAVAPTRHRRLARATGELRAVLIAFAVSRLLIAGLVLAGRNATVRGRFWQPGGLLEALTQWDSAHYIHIARYGYFHTPETWGTAGFFPFFPLLTRAMSFLFHDFRIAGVVTANICFLAAAILLHRLVRIDFPDRRVADATVTFLMFSPVSFFFSMAYTEATFLLLAVAAFLAARRNRWLLAGICGMCLAATRNVGVWMAVPLFIEHVRQAWQADNAGSRRCSDRVCARSRWCRWDLAPICCGDTSNPVMRWRLSTRRRIGDERSPLPGRRSAHGGADVYLLTGWSQPEPGWRWTEGTSAALEFSVPKIGRDLALRARLSALTRPADVPKQRAIVYATGEKFAEWEVGGVADFKAVIPAAVAETADALRIELQTPDAVSPSALGIGDDPRVLGVCVYELQITGR